MKIIVDQNIPYAVDLLQQHGEVVSVDGRHIRPECLRQADALLVRSITQVDADLLSQAAQLKFVGTATIGTEHIDQPLLQQRDIDFSSAPGCNAIAVGEYVASALIAAAQHRQQPLAGLRIAIVGAGNTGSQVGRCAQALGMTVEYYDPPLKAQGLRPDSIGFERVLTADVISLHVPLTQSGAHPTQHLLNAECLAQLGPEQIVVNACRGAVVDNHALLAQAKQDLAPLLIWDVWEFEPQVLRELVPYVFIASPHIAGYSLEGKMRGTSMIYHAMCQSLALVANDRSAELLPKAEVPVMRLTEPASFEYVARLCQWVYQPFADDKRFRQYGLNAKGFDDLRKYYPQRREFSTLPLVSAIHQPMLDKLGFTFIEN